MKIVKTLLLIILVMVLIVGSGLIYLVKFNENSPFGKTAKNSVLTSSFLVKAFNLDKPGDAKYIYLLDKNRNINVNIYYSDSYLYSMDIDDWVKDIINDTISKNAIVSKKPLQKELLKDYYTDDELKHLAKFARKETDALTLNVFYLSSYKPDPDYLGITLNRDSIFIFKKSLASLGENENISDRLERSTIMHEWGHLLGLPHINEANCVMSDAVHLYTDRTLWVSEAPVEYCAETLYLLKSLRN
jgi:hypothetical protein